MKNKQLTVALVNSILRVLDQVGPSRTNRRQCRPHHCGWWGVAVHWQEPGVALDLDGLRWIGGDPETEPSSLAPAHAPNPRVRVLERLPSPSPDPNMSTLIEFCLVLMNPCRMEVLFG
jgi:hypothetical protein